MMSQSRIGTPIPAVRRKRGGQQVTEARAISRVLCDAGRSMCLTSLRRLTSQRRTSRRVGQGPGGRCSPAGPASFAGRTRDREAVQRFRRKSRSDLACGFLLLENVRN
eukprot:1783060-Prymnesium_polylepis.1